MTTQPLSSTARASDRANNPADDGWTFRAPRHSDLVTCPYCGDDNLDRCNWCDGTGEVLAEDVMTELDLHRLDCAVDALLGADLSAHGETLSRIASNLNDLMENNHGHAH